MSDDEYIPFSQRHGISPIPPQLKLGQVSAEHRRLIDYCLDLEIDRVKCYGGHHTFFDGKWERVAKDFHVLFLNQKIGTYDNNAFQFKAMLEKFVRELSYGNLFDLVEFFARHPQCGGTLKENLANTFTKARSAYRLIEGQVIAVGTEQQAYAVEKAILDAEQVGAGAAKKHLMSAGSELRNGKWADSVRESIHAVEAMARKIVPNTDALGPALSQLESKGHIHGGLKKAFGSLYGYASDEQGVRHPLVLNDIASVDEADALFMLGACASFVSYLIARDK